MVSNVLWNDFWCVLWVGGSFIWMIHNVHLLWTFWAPCTLCQHWDKTVTPALRWFIFEGAWTDFSRVITHEIYQWQSSRVLKINKKSQFLISSKWYMFQLYNSSGVMRKNMSFLLILKSQVIRKKIKKSEAIEPDSFNYNYYN